MTASTVPARSLAALDDRITRALAALRRARATAASRPTPGASRTEARAEENLNVLLDYRRAVLERTAPGRR